MTVQIQNPCPYCNNEMFDGSIMAYEGISWTPEGEGILPISRNAVSQNGILLAKYTPFRRLGRPAKVKAFYCPECKKIVIDMN